MSADSKLFMTKNAMQPLKKFLICIRAKVIFIHFFTLIIHSLKNLATKFPKLSLRILELPRYTHIVLERTNFKFVKFSQSPDWGGKNRD